MDSKRAAPPPGTRPAAPAPEKVAGLAHLLTTKQAAPILKRRVLTLRNWRARGEGPRYTR
jgi:hypothetical protein